MGYETYDATAKVLEQHQQRYEDEETSERGWVTRQRVRRLPPSEACLPLT
jgi:predicted kinase